MAALSALAKAFDAPFSDAQAVSDILPYRVSMCPDTYGSLQGFGDPVFQLLLPDELPHGIALHGRHKAYTIAGCQKL